MSNTQNNLKEVSRKIQEIQKSAERTGETFNVFSFSILNNEKTHSAIIAELLNPLGSHNQETLFLKLFLDQLLKKLQEDQKDKLEQLRERLEQIQKDELKLDKCKVEAETPKKDGEGEPLGQIDILIESHGIKSDSSDSGDVCIVIENKIHDAPDQKRQLGRYYEYALDTGKEPGIIYLTRGGREPENYTLYGGDPNKFYGSEPDKIPNCRRLPKDAVVCLSYKDFIDEWLDACINKVAHIPQIKKILHQYRITVRKLTKQLPSEVERYIERIYTGERIKGDILKGLQHELQCELQCVFWKKLKERLADGLTLSNGLTFKNPKFQLYKSDMNDDPEILDEDLDAKLIKKIEDIKERRYSSLGLTFSIPKSLPGPGYDKHEVAFRVFYERAQVHSYFTYGFVFRRKDTLQRDKIKEHKDALEQYTRLGYQNEEEKDDGWISWTYFRYEPENFITESKETLIRKLISEINLALSKAR